LVTNDRSAMVELTHLYQSSRRLSICAVFSGLEEIMERLGDTLVRLAPKGSNKGEPAGRVRCLTSFTQEQQTHLVEMFLRNGIQVRHIADFPSLSFTLVENDDGLVTLVLGLWQSLLISTDPAYTRHFQQFFDQLWSCGMNAGSRIDEIRSGTELTEFEVIGNPEEAMKRIWDGITEAHEVLMLLSSPGMLRLQDRAGTLRIMKELVETRPMGISIRVLVPSDGEVEPPPPEEGENKMVAPLPPPPAQPVDPRKKLELRYMDKSLTTCPNMLIIDRERCFILETKSTASDDLYHSIGITTYTKSQSIANSNAAIFESLWKLSEMFQKLASREKSQEEFIKIAAHELRTPVQAVLTYSEIAMAAEGDEKKEEAEGRSGREDGSKNSPASTGIYRNALRLKNLVDDLLDVARIENNTFQIYPEPFALNRLIMNVVEDFTNSTRREEDDLDIVFETGGGREEEEEEAAGAEKEGEKEEEEEEQQQEDILITADKERLTQVLSNLLRNAIEFTKQGTIVVSLQKVVSGAPSSSHSAVEVTVRDSGRGIDPAIMSLLFSKYTQKSRFGSGLGLYLSKSIIDAHGGRIWGMNNEGDRGATFGFSIPLGPASRGP
jgi:two-component system, OmpR family, sensor histidine kinase VicK